MTAKEMLGKVDHTQLKAFATWEEAWMYRPMPERTILT